MKLIIVESPAKCKKIESFLGKEYNCIASYGHLRELPGLKNINIKNFNPLYVLSPSKKKQITLIKKKVKEASEVILATDDDREGEAIAWHICEMCKLPVETTKRIIFHEITKNAILSSLENYSYVNMNKVYSQQTRQILDIIVGFRISPKLWTYIQNGLSAGRCQTPALKLIYDNHLLPNNQTFNYDVKGYFTSNNLKYILDSCLEEPEEFLEKCKNYDFIMSLNPSYITKKSPPKPLITSSIQQKASNLYNFSPKLTMSICQKLYESGYITYMRTDNACFSKEFINSAKKTIIKNWGESYVNKNINNLSSNQSKPGQEAHEGIRPTHIEWVKLPDDFENNEKKLYKLIWNQSIEACMSEAIGEKIKSIITAPLDRKFIYETENITFKGWLIVQNKIEDNYFHYLINLKLGKVNYNKITANQILKGSKSHISEAQLVQLLEKKNIGRPSTFSSIIEKIKERGYVKKENIEGKKIMCKNYELENNNLNSFSEEKTFQGEKNKLIIQDIGIKVIEICYKYYNDLFDYSYTEIMENKLDKIELKQEKLLDVCKECYDLIDVLSKNISLNKKDTINIEVGLYKNEKLYIKKGRYGYYASWGNNNRSLDKFELLKTQEVQLITIEEITKYLENNETNFLRKITLDMSIRKSKHGDYIYYKNKSMKKPRFLKLDTFEGDYLNCDLSQLKDYIKEKYKIY